VFKSWAVTKGPSLNPADKRLAVEVEDHPLDYGDFEGTIPKGEYGGGTVMLWDRGFWMPEGTKDIDAALRKGELKFTRAGEKLQGSFVLVHMKHDRDHGKRNNWLLIKHRDESSASDDHQRGQIVASGRSLNRSRWQAWRQAVHEPLAPRRPIPAPSGTRRRPKSSRPSGGPWQRCNPQRPGAKPAKQPPRLCRALSPSALQDPLAAPQGDDWVHEIKSTATACSCAEDGSAPCARAKGLDWTGKFQAVAKAAAFTRCDH
jgi:bifunctional non-homologous end joining protein LigD